MPVIVKVATVSVSLFIFSCPFSLCLCEMCDCCVPCWCFLSIFWASSATIPYRFMSINKYYSRIIAVKPDEADVTSVISNLAVLSGLFILYDRCSYFWIITQLLVMCVSRFTVQGLPVYTSCHMIMSFFWLNEKLYTVWYILTFKSWKMWFSSQPYWKFLEKYCPALKYFCFEETSIIWGIFFISYL